MPWKLPIQQTNLNSFWVHGSSMIMFIPEWNVQPWEESLSNSFGGWDLPEATLWNLGGGMASWAEGLMAYLRPWISTWIHMELLNEIGVERWFPRLEKNQTWLSCGGTRFLSFGDHNLRSVACLIFFSLLTNVMGSWPSQWWTSGGLDVANANVIVCSSGDSARKHNFPTPNS